MGENMYIVVRLINKIEYYVWIDNCVLVLDCEECLTDRCLSLDIGDQAISAWEKNISNPERVGPEADSQPI